MNCEQKTKVSVITTSYNYSEYISQTIESVLAQTFSDWELIIVDDASTDNSVEIIKSFLNDKRIKLVVHDKNKGLREAIKTGLEQAQGEWIAFLESDDTLNPDTLQMRINEANNADIIFNAVNLFGDSEKMQNKLRFVNETENILNKITFPANVFKLFQTRNVILTLSSVMFKKELINEQALNAPVDEFFDWWFYIHITQNSNVYYINQKLTNWRIHSDSYISRSRKRKYKLVNAMAYYDIFKQKKSFELFLLALNCFVKMLFVRIWVNVSKLIK
ncbi:glycosyltransferase family 2 protein [bacterium]|nr:glycosyltransferase family 2 protein [bacterium]